MTTKAPIFLQVVACALLLTSCGFIESDEDRIADAKEQMVGGDYRAAMIQLKNVLGGGSDSAEARLMLAEVSLGLGDPLSAEKEMARAIELGAAESIISSLHFKILAAKNDYTGVLAALGLDTFSLPAKEKLRVRGKALLGLGNFETAAATFRELLDVEPTSGDAKTGLADSLALGGDLDGARALLEEVVADETENVEAWHSLAEVLFRIGDYEQAAAAFATVAEAIKPQTDIRRYASILAGKTEVHMVLNDDVAARRSLDRLTGVAPNAPATLFLAARMARLDKDYALASRHLQTLLNVSPDNPQAQLFLANIQMMQGSFAQAEALLGRVVALAPGNLQARKLLAQVQLRRSRPGGAVEALVPLLETGDVDADLYTILGQASIQQGLSKEAIEQFKNAVLLSPEDVEAKLNLASAYFFADDVTSAITILESIEPLNGIGLRRERLLMMALVANSETAKADEVADSLLATSETPEMASTVVADHYLRTDRGELARTVLRELVTAHPDMIGAKTSLGRIELIDGNVNVARGLFSSVMETDANNLAALLGLARVAQLQDDGSSLMVDTLQHAASVHPAELAPRAMLAQEFMENGLAEKAEQIATELVAIGFRNRRISELVANIFAEVGRVDDALLHFQSAAKLDPEYAPAQLGMARASLALGRTVDARQALVRALEISPGWPPAMTILTLIEIGQGQIDDATRLVERFQALHPDNPAAFVLEGEVLFYQGYHVEAAQAFEKAVALGAGRSTVLRGFQALVNGRSNSPEKVLIEWLDEHSNDTLTRKFLAQHYQTNGRRIDAVSEYVTVLEQNPDDEVVMNNLAWLYQQQNDLQSAAELAKRAYDINPDNGPIADTLGWIYRDLGELEKGLELLSKASRLSPENGEIQYHYAVALQEADDVANARRILQELKAKDVQFPSRQRADKLLGEL